MLIIGLEMVVARGARSGGTGRGRRCAAFGSMLALHRSQRRDQPARRRGHAPAGRTCRATADDRSRRSPAHLLETPHVLARRRCLGAPATYDPLQGLNHATLDPQITPLAPRRPAAFSRRANATSMSAPFFSGRACRLWSSRDGRAFLTDQRFFDPPAPAARQRTFPDPARQSVNRIHNSAVMSTRGEHLVRADRGFATGGGTLARGGFRRLSTASSTELASASSAVVWRLRFPMPRGTGLASGRRGRAPRCTSTAGWLWSGSPPRARSAGIRRGRWENGRARIRLRSSNCFQPMPFRSATPAAPRDRSAG